MLGKVAELSLGQARERAMQAKAAARKGVDLDQDERAEVKRREDEERRKAEPRHGADGRRGVPRGVRDNPLETQWA